MKQVMESRRHYTYDAYNRLMRAGANTFIYNGDGIRTCCYLQ